MKKLLLLLLPFFAMAQSPDATQIENILLLNNTKQNSATRVIVQDSITKELKFVLRASLVPQANASTSGTVRTTTAEVNPQVYTIGIVDNKLDAKLNANQKGAINGVATLNSIGKIPNEQIPAVAISETFPISSEAQMIGLSQAEQGDIAIRSDVSKAFILRQSPSSVLGNWSELLTPASTVTSVAGKVGAVILNSGDVGLGNVNNTSDANKPVSEATQTALNAKVSGSGTINQLSKFTASGAVGPSSIFDNGNVGINKTNPTESLDVSGNGKFSGSLSTNNVLFWGAASQGILSFGNNVVKVEAITANTSIALLPTGTGNVGIGITNPTERLDVVGNGKFSGSGIFGGTIFANAQGANLRVFSDGTDENDGFIGMGGNSDFIISNWNVNRGLKIKANGNYEFIGTGNVGINQSNPTEKLDVVGNGKFSGNVTATAFFQSSDIRLKKIIKRDGDVIYFKWKDKRDSKIHIGYIAQKVRETHKDQVEKDDKGYLSVNYIEILVEKTRNLEKEIELLKAK